jgi:hypothetical protein
LMSCLPESTGDDRMDHMLDCSARWRSLRARLLIQEIFDSGVRS